VCIPDGAGLLVVGSNYGDQRHPGWVHNLLATPECTVAFRGAVTGMAARPLEGAELEDAWAKAVDWVRGYAIYRQRAHPREIRVFRLEPTSPPALGRARTADQSNAYPDGSEQRHPHGEDHVPEQQVVSDERSGARRAAHPARGVMKRRAPRWGMRGSRPPASDRTTSGNTKFIRALALPLAAVLVVVQPARASTTAPPPPKCDAGNCLDPLFTVQYPHTRTASTAAGVTIPLPVHYYDAALFITLGTADIKSERALTASTDFEPVVTEAGDGIGALFIADYADDDLGPYHEAMIAFPVHEGGPVVVADDPGAMTAALLDPGNRIWGVRLLLDSQLPIDAGRELYGIPKVPSPASMPLTITPTHVKFDFSDANGTPIVSGDVVLPTNNAVRSTAGLATQPSLLALAKDTISRGYVHFGFAYRDIRRPSQLQSAEVAARTGANAQVASAPYDTSSTISVNRGAAFGSDLAALDLQPRASVVLENLHLVLDDHL
jgi:deazaflavin-dependent oxidoreductase (nitroreductase family)